MEVVSYVVTENGSSGFLEYTVESLSKVVDYILVCVSESSDDGTLNWCRQNSLVDEVISEDMDWEQEAEIRNMARETALEQNPDAEWLVALDDDEVFATPEEAKKFFRNEENYGIDSAGARFYELWEELKYRQDHVWGPDGEVRRIFEKVGSFKGNIEGEQNHCGRIPGHPETAPRPGPDEDMEGFLPVIHLGWWNRTREELVNARDQMLEDNEATGRLHRKKIEPIPEEPELRELPTSFKRELRDLGVVE